MGVLAIQGSSRSFDRAPHELAEDEATVLFGALLEEADEDFRKEPAYVLDMADHGALIHYKGEMWRVKREAERAEADARMACTAAHGGNGWRCQATSGCGFGDCHFALEANRGVMVPTPTVRDSKVRQKPVGAVHPEYRPADLLPALLEREGIHRPPKVSTGRRSK